MYLPTTIYESLPLAYSGAGVAAIFQLELPIGKLAGGLLLVVAILVSHMRRKHRGL